MPNYRKLYESVFGKIPKDDLGRSYEVHHIDGNHNNNSIENLLCVSIEEHYNIHLTQGDFNAANLIATRINLPYYKKTGFKNPHSEEAKQNMRKPKSSKENYRKPKSLEHKEAIRAVRLGTTRSESTKLKLSLCKIGKTPSQNLIKTVCPFCNKEGQHIAMKRWHFTNCKQKEVAYA
jgi:hypothetical protein